jgi:hypothetical protein
MPKLDEVQDASVYLQPEQRETSNNSEPMQVKDAIKLGQAVFDLLSSCRGRQGILTLSSIPRELRKGLSSDEQYKVLSWMKKRQNGKSKVA